MDEDPRKLYQASLLPDEDVGLVEIGEWLFRINYYDIIKKIEPSLYSRYYAKACNEWWGPSPRLSTWTTQLRRNVAEETSRWRPWSDLTDPGVEPMTCRVARDELNNSSNLLVHYDIVIVIVV